MHFHSLFLDGLFVRGVDGALRFHPCRPATTEEVEQLVVRLPPRCATCDGYNLHAGVGVGGEDREALERLCPYVGRPPLAKVRFEEGPGDTVVLRLRRPWSDETSGKSTLVMDTLAPALQRTLGHDVSVAPHGGLTLGETVDRVVVVDQSPIGRTPRSTPATYTKVLDPLRKLYAGTIGAMERGWDAGRFSFNSPGGRCATCEGRGSILVEMHFLPDLWVICEHCGGKRFGTETLAIRWQGRSIADVLAMRTDEALELFVNHRSLQRQLQALVDVGLGYLTLGQPATTLSGGEAQRVKLAAELTSRRGHCVYVLDEPTTGLHLADVAKLVGVPHRLVDQGHIVITIEHHLDVLRQADWIVDMGPEGGAAGGRVVAEGTPADLARADTATGAALRVARRSGLLPPSPSGRMRRGAACSACGRSSGVRRRRCRRIPARWRRRRRSRRRRS